MIGSTSPLTHSSTLSWKIPWTEKPGRLQSMGSQRVGHDWANSSPSPSSLTTPVSADILETLLQRRNKWQDRHKKRSAKEVKAEALPVCEGAGVTLQQGLKAGQVWKCDCNNMLGEGAATELAQIPEKMTALFGELRMTWLFGREFKILSKYFGMWKIAQKWDAVYPAHRGSHPVIRNSFELRSIKGHLSLSPFSGWGSGLSQNLMFLS